MVCCACIKSSLDIYKIHIPITFTVVALLWDNGMIVPTAVSDWSDVIMSAMASQLTGVWIVLSGVCSGPDLRKHKKTSKLRVTGLCEGISPVTGEFPAQMASNAENVSI